MPLFAAVVVLLVIMLAGLLIFFLTNQQKVAYFGFVLFVVPFCLLLIRLVGFGLPALR